MNNYSSNSLRTMRQDLNSFYVHISRWLYL